MTPKKMRERFSDATAKLTAREAWLIAAEICERLEVVARPLCKATIVDGEIDSIEIGPARSAPVAPPPERLLSQAERWTVRPHRRLRPAGLPVVERG